MNGGGGEVSSERVEGENSLEAMRMESMGGSKKVGAPGNER